MSFGWSTGDIVGAVKLINSIVSSLRNTSGAREQFEELETELIGLERALEGINSLTRTASPRPEIEALKFVSLYCVETLRRFHEKIKPFEDSLGAQSQMTRMRAAPRMVRWQLLIKKDLPELRQYLMAHVGYLNLELSTASLKSASRANNYLEEVRLQNERTIALIVQRMDNTSITDKRVGEIRETVDRIWNSNNELANVLRILAEKTTTPPSSGYTWAQEPIRFENALGNVIPVASESDWDILEAIISAQFSKGPGRRKVFAGEYELFESSADLMLPINARNCPRLRPGMRITMAIIIGQYSGSQRCPRLGCSSKSVSDVGVKGITGRLCSSCGTWVRKSDKILPKPLRPPEMGHVALQPPATGHISAGPRSPSNLVSAATFSSTYPERLAYKNISIYVTELPPTPKILQDNYLSALSEYYAATLKSRERQRPVYHYYNPPSQRKYHPPPLLSAYHFLPPEPLEGRSRTRGWQRYYRRSPDYAPPAADSNFFPPGYEKTESLNYHSSREHSRRRRRSYEDDDDDDYRMPPPPLPGRYCRPPVIIQRNR